MEPRVMPSTIDYSQMLPLSIPAMANRRKFYPTNGSTFSNVGNRLIRIEVGHPTALLDPTHSYLEMTLKNNSGGPDFGLDMGGANSLFRSVRVEQAGKVLSYTQASNRLHCAILSPVMMSTEGLGSGSNTELTRGYNVAVGNSQVPLGVGNAGENYDVSVHNGDAQITNQVQVRLSCNVTSGLFSQDKLIPLPLVNPNAPLTLVLELESDSNVGSWNTIPPAVPNAGSIEILECAYVGHMIEVGPDVINQFRMVQQDMGGQIAISGQDYEYFTQVLPAQTSGSVELLCPARKRSIKSFFWCSQSNDYANTFGPITAANAFNLSFAGNANISSYQFAVGPVLYPPGDPVSCWGKARGAGTAGNAFKRGQCALELAKAVGTMSKANPTGTLNTITYGTDNVGLSSGENGVGGITHCAVGAARYLVCPFGLSTDSFSRDIAESGVDSATLAQQTRLLLNWGATAGVADDSGLEDQIVHMWVLFDQHYYFNGDGSVTYSN